jgi:rhodanese-related sulfurtransferase
MGFPKGRGALPILRDAAIVAVAFSGIGLGFNAFHSNGIPLITSEAYEVFVPCPEPVGKIDALEPADPMVQDPRSLRIDARSPGEHARWHLPDSRNIPFDYLDEVSPENARIVAKSGAARVVVYGDGRDPDSGRELARELSGRGIRNVFYVTGGAPALEGGAP